MNWTQCIKDLTGRQVTIAPRPLHPKTGEVNNINTGGKKGTITQFDTKAGKYEINFNNSWCGWYSFNELILHP